MSDDDRNDPGGDDPADDLGDIYDPLGGDSSSDEPSAGEFSDEFNLGAPIDESSTDRESLPDMNLDGGGTDDSFSQAGDGADSRSGEHAIVRWKEEPDESDEESQEPIKFRSQTERETEMDMTPMVDVTFLLLIFFMVTASFTLHKSIEQPPQTEEEPSINTIEDPEQEPDYILVFVDEYNTFQIIYGDDTWECPSEQELIVNLRNIKNDTSAGATPTDLLVMAHGDCMHERVVMAMDAGTEVGMASIQVTMTEFGPE